MICPLCKYGYYADDSKFYMKKVDFERTNKYNITETKKIMYACPKCGVTFIQGED